MLPSNEEHSHAVDKVWDNVGDMGDVLTSKRVGGQ